VRSGDDNLIIEKITEVSRLLDEIEELEAAVVRIKELRAAANQCLVPDSRVDA
jgi:hypothetical protein